MSVGAKDFSPLRLRPDLTRSGRDRFDGEGASNAEFVFGYLWLVVEDFLISMGSNGGVHVLLHGLASGVEGVEGVAGSLWPVFGEIERDFPFLEVFPSARGVGVI